MSIFLIYSFCTNKMAENGHVDKALIIKFITMKDKNANLSQNMKSSHLSQISIKDGSGSSLALWELAMRHWVMRITLVMRESASCQKDVDKP